MAEKLPSHDGSFTGCFGCGADNAISLGLRYEREGDTVLARVTLGQEYAGYEDFVHGGIVATVLDESMGWALLHLAECYGVTRSLNITYRRPVSIGRPLTVRARVLETEGTRVTIEARLEDERSRLLASATGDWIRVRSERARAKADR